MTITFVSSRLANLEVFRDTEVEELRRLVNGHKRASRVLQNALLIAADLPPVLLTEVMIDAYVDAQLVYYETGDYLMHRGAQGAAHHTNAHRRECRPSIPQVVLPKWKSHM